MAPFEVLTGKQLEHRDAEPVTSAALLDSRETEVAGRCPREKVSMEGRHLGFFSRRGLGDQCSEEGGGPGVLWAGVCICHLGGLEAILGSLVEEVQAGCLKR